MDLNSIVSSIQSQALGDVDVVLLEQKGEGQEQGMVHVYLVPRAPSESSRTPTPSLGSVSSPANPMMSPPYVAPNVTPNNLTQLGPSPYIASPAPGLSQDLMRQISSPFSPTYPNVMSPSNIPLAGNQHGEIIQRQYPFSPGPTDSNPPARFERIPSPMPSPNRSNFEIPRFERIQSPVAGSNHANVPVPRFERIQAPLAGSNQTNVFRFDSVASPVQNVTQATRVPHIQSPVQNLTNSAQVQRMYSPLFDSNPSEALSLTQSLYLTSSGAIKATVYNTPHSSTTSDKTTHEQMTQLKNVSMQGISHLLTNGKNIILVM